MKEEEEKGKLGVGFFKTEGIVCADALRSKGECGWHAREQKEGQFG